MGQGGRGTLRHFRVQLPDSQLPKLGLRLAARPATAGVDRARPALEGVEAWLSLGADFDWGLREGERRAKRDCAPAEPRQKLTASLSVHLTAATGRGLGGGPDPQLAPPTPTAPPRLFPPHPAEVPARRAAVANEDSTAVTARGPVGGRASRRRGLRLFDKVHASPFGRLAQGLTRTTT